MTNKWPKIESNLIFSLADQMVLSILSFGLTFYLAKALDLNEFALYSIIFTAQTIFVYLYSSIIGQYILVHGHGFGQKYRIKLHIFLTIVTPLVFGLILWALQSVSSTIRYFSNDNWFYLSTIIYGTGFLTFENHRRFSYNGKKYKDSLIGSILIAGSIVLSMFFFRNLSINGIFCLIGGILFVYSTVKVLLCRTNGLEKSLKTMINIFDFSKWLVFGAIFYIIGNRIFILLLDMQSTPLMVSQFRLLESVFAIALIFQASMENYVLVKFKDNKSKPNFGLYLEVSKYFIAINLLIIFLAVFGKCIIDEMFLNFENISVYTIFIAAFGYMLFVQVRIFSVLMRVVNNTKPIFVSNLFSAFSIVVMFAFDSITLETVFFTLCTGYLISLAVYVYFYLHLNA